MKTPTLAEIKAHLPTAHSTRRAKTPVPETVDVAIVGAGTAGLSAGAYLAKQGYSVALFDPHYVAGGCATTFSRGSGAGRYTFDVGLHYIGDCHEGGPIHAIVNDELGLNQQFSQLDPDGYDTLLMPDFEFKVPSNKELYRERLLDLFPAEKKGIDRYLRFTRQVQGVVDRLFSSYGRMSLPSLLHVLLHAPMLPFNQHRTLGNFLDSCTKDERLRAVIAGQHGDYGLAPAEVSVLLHIGLQNHFMGGAYYPKGGGQAISDKLAALIESHGGSVLLRRGVRKILVEGGRAVGVRTEADRHGHSCDVRARAVLSTADLKTTMLSLLGPDHLSRGMIGKIGGWQWAASLFITCLAVDTSMAAKGMRASNYWTVDSYDLDAAYRDSRGQDRPRISGAYITSGTLKDPGYAFHAPAGIDTLEVMTLVPGDLKTWGLREADLLGGAYSKKPEYLARKQQVEDDLIARLEAVFPGTEQHIVFRESASPVTHARYTRATEGSGYGLALTPAQFNLKRPDEFGPVKGLFLGGMSTRSGHGILGALASGRVAARSLTRELGPIRG